MLVSMGFVGGVQLALRNMHSMPSETSALIYQASRLRQQTRYLPTNKLVARWLLAVRMDPPLVADIPTPNGSTIVICLRLARCRKLGSLRIERIAILVGRATDRFV